MSFSKEERDYLIQTINESNQTLQQVAQVAQYNAEMLHMVVNHDLHAEILEMEGEIEEHYKNHPNAVVMIDEEEMESMTIKDLMDRQKKQVEEKNEKADEDDSLFFDE